ncbi:hypothetical protein ANCDUO_01168 [Ancylostoma duodenale]|uniref:Uncharacterized protein n=1 Tax=Ancylostoma duodenale TaxID=51022 RepID=A0A0C2HA24_9BILA|nr:hypothetical protein ANCDUO_01168 [Ancylostoma duodenale]
MEIASHGGESRKLRSLGVECQSDQAKKRWLIWRIQDLSLQYLHRFGYLSTATPSLHELRAALRLFQVGVLYPVFRTFSIVFFARTGSGRG